jgi:hypothetical protein
MKVYFLVIGPAPVWAVPKGNRNNQGPNLGWAPSTNEYRQFIEAAGRRYSGSYTPPPQSIAAAGGPYTDPLPDKPIPRVSYWGIWNEPNERSWLTPWFRTLSGHRRQLLQPQLYRGLVDAGWSGLVASGHRDDTIMVGETANRGIMTPTAFFRALYCVGRNLRPLRRAAASAFGCPRSGPSSRFAAAHPGLFKAAVAHHPYGFQVAPNKPPPDRTFITINDVPSFERTLNRIFSDYGQHPSGGVPLYLTEWGYKTNPPNPYVPTSPAQQAEWINQGEYMTWKWPYVHGLTQFLLVDSPPKAHSKKGSALYWSTFQTGLEYINRTPKPSFQAFQIPIWLPNPHHGSSVGVWGELRPADHTTTQTASVQFLPSGGSVWQQLGDVQTNSAEGFLFTNVSIPSAGAVRLAWSAPDGTTLYSRAASVS